MLIFARASRIEVIQDVSGGVAASRSRGISLGVVAWRRRLRSGGLAGTKQVLAFPEPDHVLGVMRSPR